MGAADEQTGRCEDTGSNSYRSSAVKMLVRLAADPWALGRGKSARSRTILFLSSPHVPAHEGQSRNDTKNHPAMASGSVALASGISMPREKLLRMMRFCMPLMLLWATAPVAAQEQPGSREPHLEQRTSVVLSFVGDSPWQSGRNISLPLFTDGARLPRDVNGRLYETLQQEKGGRSPLLFPTIGLFVGAITGYFVGRDNEPDTMFPAYLYTVPVGAGAGFVIGIIVEDITSQIEAEY